MLSEQLILSDSTGYTCQDGTALTVTALNTALLLHGTVLQVTAIYKLLSDKKNLVHGISVTKDNPQTAYQ